MKRYTITAHALNVRNAPTSSDSFNIIGVLPFQTVVALLEEVNSIWWRVKTLSSGLEGFVASRYLEPMAEEAILVEGISKADYANHKSASLFTKGAMHKPIGTPKIPYRDQSNADTKRSSIAKLVDTLNVERSERYRPTSQNTFCNIYAYDFCHFCDTYIPRVWWKPKSLKLLIQGEKVEVLYGETVYELNANALHDWLLEWGDDFGWIRMQVPDQLQNIVNQEGGVGIICAKRRQTSRSGHITVVVPETDEHQANRQAGVILHPLQSQAGSRNRNYFSAAAGTWWRKDKFASFVFFYHP